MIISYNCSTHIQAYMMMTHVTATYGEWPTILPGEESGNRSIQIICWFCRESPVWGILGWPKTQTQCHSWKVAEELTVKSNEQSLKPYFNHVHE